MAMLALTSDTLPCQSLRVPRRNIALFGLAGILVLQRIELEGD
jgi:hypothetical protein